MTKQRLDQWLVKQGHSETRSQAEKLVKLGKVKVNNQTITKPELWVGPAHKIEVAESEHYVSRAGLKLASVAQVLGVDFAGKTVLDVGSSTGGFTDYALQHGAKKVYAVDVGTEQLHPSLRGNPLIVLHEKTDIRDFTPPVAPDVVVMDVSFISLREILPHIVSLSSEKTVIVAMLKPQFEASRAQMNNGVIKNDSVRRRILKDFELWAKQYFIIQDKCDSDVHGAKGNQERFYLLRRIM